MRKNGLLKKKNNEEKYKDIKKVIYLFGKIPLEYEGNMEKFFNIINDIKKIIVNLIKYTLFINMLNLNN